MTDRIDREGLELHHLATEELAAVLPAAHRLAGRRRVRFAELRDEAFISFREGGALRHLLVAAAADAGFVPRIALESNESRRICSLVSRGLGVAILPRSDGESAGSTVCVSVLAGPELQRDVTLAARAQRRLSPAAFAFRTLTLRMFEEPSAIMEP